MSVDLTTRYGRLTLRSPLVVGACPLTANEQNRVAIETAGAGAIVLPSLFEEQVVVWNEKKGREVTPRERSVIRRGERLGSHAVCENAESYLALVNRASVQSTIPVIASLNGDMVGNWLDFAGEIEEAGAAAIELAVHHSFSTTTGPREIEESLVELVGTINEAISIPLFLKLGREYTCISDLTRRLLSGVQGVVLFGRKPEVDICLDSIELKSSWGLTQPHSIAGSIASILRVHSLCPAMAIAACGGIASSGDVIKSLLAGADVAMVTSALYREGPDVIRTLCDGLVEFMESHHFQSLADLAQRRPIEFDDESERVAYVQSLSSRLTSIHPGDQEPAISGDRFGHLERRAHARDGDD